MLSRKKKILCVGLAVILAFVCHIDFFINRKSNEVSKKYSEMSEELETQRRKNQEVQSELQALQQKYDNEMQIFQEHENLHGEKQQEWETYLADIQAGQQRYAELLRTSILNEGNYNLPLFNYNFDGVNSTSGETNVGKTITGLLAGNSLWGKLLAGTVVDERQKINISEIQAIVNFNNAMELYIEQHSKGLDILRKEYAQRQYMVNMTTPSGDAVQDLYYLKTLQALLDKNIVDGQIQINRSDLLSEEDIKELCNVAVSAYCIANAYEILFGDGYWEWSDLEDRIYEIVEEELGENSKNYTDEILSSGDFWIPRQYVNVIENVCGSHATIDGVKFDYRRFFVMGSGDRDLYAYYRQNSNNEKEYFFIQEYDYRGNVLATYFYDCQGNVVALSDKSKREDYYFWEGYLLQDGTSEILLYAEWIRDIFSNDTKATNQEYINNRACLNR